MTTTADTTLRILVAEDNPDHRFLLVRTLRRVATVPTAIQEAHDGEQALDCLRGRGEHAGQPLPHLVFLDLKMPRVSGFEVLEALRSDTELREIPVVVLTSSTRQVDVDTAYRLGTNSYVTKSQAGGIESTLPRVAQYWTSDSRLPARAGR